MQGVTQPKSDEFSLSSGDFPTLGSDKDKSVLNSEFQGIIFCIYIMVFVFLICISIFLLTMVHHFMVRVVSFYL